jgi:hypothetical protein
MRNKLKNNQPKSNTLRFQESLNTAVFTTSFVINDKKEITRVFHYIEDGAWQFMSDDYYVDYNKVAKIVSLEEILNLDPTLTELADMEMGHFAQRLSLKQEWIIKEIDNAR